MKKLLALVMAVVMMMGMVSFASAEDAAPTTSTAWLLYFASNHETDSANFPWWPQHQRVDQPASETGVEATNAQVTGPGAYTVGLKFNWQKAEGAIQFNLILEDAEVLFPGYYVDITDVRVNGVSIPINENYYGAYHDDTNDGMVPLYNTYWDPAFTPDAVGPQNYRAFDGTPEDATHMVINPADIVAGDTIEVDFIVAAEAGAAPEELGERPSSAVLLDAPEEAATPETITTAWLYLYDGDHWPQNTGVTPNGNSYSTNAEITGPGYYTVSFTAKWVSDNPDANAINGLNNLWLIFENGGDVMPSWQYRVQVTDVKLDGESVALNGNTGYGQIYWEHWGTPSAFQANDSYAPLFDGSTLGGHMSSWDDSAATAQVVDPSMFENIESIEISFFVTDQVGVKPAPPEEVTEVWYNSNTVGVAGLSLKDLGIADDWHNIVPVDLTSTGWQVFTLVGADAHEIGYAYVAVNNGSVTVTCEYTGGPTAMIIKHSECIKWFTSLDEITAEALASTEGGLTSADAVSVANDLGGADIAFLSINNKVSWRSPIDAKGNNLPRYWRNLPNWVAYRESLMTMIETPAE